MRFGQAIDEVTKHGKMMRRACWDEGHIVGFRLPDGRSDMTGAYFYQTFLFVGHGGEVDVTVPWSPDVFDMTAHEWELIDEQ